MDTYIAAWNEGDPERRRALVGETWTEDGTYVDPLMAGTGPDEIAAMIGAAQAQFPGHRFELSFGPDAHNDVVRFAWTLTRRERAGRARHGLRHRRRGRAPAPVTGFLETV